MGSAVPGDPRGVLGSSDGARARGVLLSKGPGKKGPKVTMTHHDPTAMLPEMELAYSYSRENQNSLSLVGTSVLP